MHNLAHHLARDREERQEVISPRALALRREVALAMREAPISLPRILSLSLTVMALGLVIDAGRDVSEDEEAAVRRTLDGGEAFRADVLAHRAALEAVRGEQE